MRYGLLINPVSGNLSLEQKRDLIGFFKKNLDGTCIVAGLDTSSREGLISAARDLSSRVDTVILIGGDGTVQDALGSLSDGQRISFFPIGSFNALKYGLEVPRNKEDFIKKIRSGVERRLDTLVINGEEALFSGIGFDAEVVVQRNALKDKGVPGKVAYWLAICQLLASNFRSFPVEIGIDGTKINTEVLDILVSKVPYYGPRLKAIPRAKINDGLVHISIITPPLYQFSLDLMRTYLVGEAIDEHFMGYYFTGKDVSVRLDSPRAMHLNGNIKEPTKDYSYSVRANRLRLV